LPGRCARWRTIKRFFAVGSLPRVTFRPVSANYQKSTLLVSPALPTGSGCLLLEAARCRACASRTARSLATCDIAGGHRSSEKIACQTCPNVECLLCDV